MTAAAVRCAVYTRKSSEEGLEQSFNSLDAQHEACVAYVQSQKHEGWTVIKERYDDGGFSGGTMDRPALKRLLDDILAGQVETVVVYKVDRLTRSLSDFAKIIEIFDAHKVSFVSVTQQFNTTTSMGRLTLNVLLSFAQFERELTGERIRDKVAASKKKGMWMGGVVPLGYDSVDHRLIVNPAEAENARQIFRQYLRLGSVTSLRNYLKQKQIHSKVRTSRTGRTSGGVTYSRGALYHLLNNRIYIGEIVHRGQSNPGQHEPIIPRKLWDEVAARLKENTRARRNRNSSASSAPSLLTGILRDTNGVRFSPTYSLKNGKRYRYYTSQAAIQQRRDRPSVARYPAQELERLIESAIHQLLGSPNLVLARLEATAKRDAAAEKARILARDWPKLEISKRHDLLRSVLDSVVVGRNSIWLEVNPKELAASLLGHSLEGSPGTEQDPGPIKLTIPFHPCRRGVELRIQTPETEASAPKQTPVPSLVKALARAHVWHARLVAGEVTVGQLAGEIGLTVRYVQRILQCAMISPELTEAIFAGEQPRNLTLASLMDNLPVDWREQTSVGSAGSG